MARDYTKLYEVILMAKSAAPDSAAAARDTEIDSLLTL
jgi:hypothetical protein